MNHLFLISVNNKEIINNIIFNDELYYIDDSFILNRKTKNKEKDNKEHKNQFYISIKWEKTMKLLKWNKMKKCRIYLNLIISIYIN